MGSANVEALRKDSTPSDGVSKDVEDKVSCAGGCGCAFEEDFEDEDDLRPVSVSQNDMLSDVSAGPPDKERRGK